MILKFCLARCLRCLQGKAQSEIRRGLINLNHYALIMAGGGGTRFWPLSRKNMPKQLLNLSGDDVMINETVKRSSGVISVDNTFIITNKAQIPEMEKVLMKDFRAENILKEPVGRNTAACILYSALHIMKKHGDGVLCVFPADHYITEQESFEKVLTKAMHTAEAHDTIVTVGIEPTFASTGYGYIKIKDKTDGKNAYDIDRFVEKPDAARAQEFLDSKMYYWNGGIFVFKISYVIELFKNHLPDLYKELSAVSESFGTEREETCIEEVYPRLQSISFDYGIMEKTDGATVIPGSFGWSDIGSFDALSAVFPTDKSGNIVKAEHVGLDTENCVIYGGKRIITTVGVSDLIIVDTDDAVLICHKEQAQRIKDLVEELKKNGNEELL